MEQIFLLHLNSYLVVVILWIQGSGFCTSSGDINLKIGWIMQWSTRNSKMEFANHFFKIHAIAFSQFSTNRTHIARNERQTILSSFFDDEWWVSTKMSSKLLSFHFSEIRLPIVLICKKTMVWILAKWFANSIFELLMLNCITCPIFRLIAQF